MPQKDTAATLYFRALRRLTTMQTPPSPTPHTDKWTVEILAGQTSAEQRARACLTVHFLTTLTACGSEHAPNLGLKWLRCKKALLRGQAVRDEIAYVKHLRLVQRFWAPLSKEQRRGVFSAFERYLGMREGRLLAIVNEEVEQLRGVMK